MRDLIPSKKQWSKWSLPSKLTTLGALFGILSNTIAIIFYFLPLDNLKQSVKSDTTQFFKISDAAIHHGISEEKYQKLIEDLAVTKYVLNSFLKIIEAEKVPIKDLDKTLREFATKYKDFLSKQTSVGFVIHGLDQGEKSFNQIQSIISAYCQAAFYELSLEFSREDNTTFQPKLIFEPTSGYPLFLMHDENNAIKTFQSNLSGNFIKYLAKVVSHNKLQLLYLVDLSGLKKTGDEHIFFNIMLYYPNSNSIGLSFVEIDRDSFKKHNRVSNAIYSSFHNALSDAIFSIKP